MQRELDNEIEELELHDKSVTQIERIVKAYSVEGMALRRKRKTIRYQLYRMRSEALGITNRLCSDEFVKIFESQNDFTNWREFSEHWDVAFDDPYRVVHRTRTTLEEWNDIVKAKYPQINENGGVSYPDIKVRKKIEAEAKEQMKHAKTKKKKTKTKTKKGS